MNCTRHLAHDHDPDCTECSKRAQAGPHYDARRGTGRTTQSVKTAIMGALCGQRVLYVTHNDQTAVELCRYAVQLIAEAVEVAVAISGRTAHRITFSNGAWLEFRSMGAAEPRGLKECYLPQRTWWDPYAQEERARLAAEEERRADAETIKQLMRKHGWHKVDDIMCRPSPKFNTLSFRT